MNSQFDDQEYRISAVPVIGGDRATDNGLWTLSMLLREIAENDLAVTDVEGGANVRKPR